MQRAPSPQSTENVSHSSTVPVSPSQRLIPVLGLACGITVSALYFNQPLLIEMARSLHVTEAR
jgi:hypothetical protein